MRNIKLRNPSIMYPLKASVLLVAFFLLPSVMTVFGQAGHTAPEPRREQLLNGLQILLWNRPGDSQVMLKLRIESGAAFDLEGKEGLMAVLSDVLFSDPTTRTYVTEELGGQLEVAVDYDAINVTLTGRASEFERLVELLRNAVINPQLSTETIGRLREARIKTVREVSLAPDAVADRAIATRLFGAYPLGRMSTGSPETLARIERGDVILARERFLNPNNAVLVCIGGVEPNRAMRAFRQLLGVWRKGEQIVPSTFRQPENPDPRTLIVDLPEAPDVEVRLATRGLARSDRDAAAAFVLALLARDRWREAVPELKQSAVSVRHVAYNVGGVFRMSASVRSSASAAQALEAARKVLQALAATSPPIAQLESARRESIATLNQAIEKQNTIADAWLDELTYNSPLAGYKEMARAINLLTPADVQRVAARLFREAPIAAVVVGDAAKLRPDLARSGAVQVLGSNDPSEEKSKSTSGQQPPSLRLGRP